MSNPTNANENTAQRQPAQLATPVQHKQDFGGELQIDMSILSIRRRRVNRRAFRG